MGIFVGVKLETHIQDHTITPKHVGYFSRFWTKKMGGFGVGCGTCITGSSSAQQMKLPQITQQAKPPPGFVFGVVWVGFINPAWFLGWILPLKKKKSQVTQVTFKEFCGKFLPPYFGEMAWAPKPVKFSRILPLRHLTHLRRVGLGRPNLRLSLIGYRWCGLMLHIQMECMVDMYI